MQSFLRCETVIIMLQSYAHIVPAVNTVVIDILCYSGEKLQRKKLFRSPSIYSGGYSRAVGLLFQTRAMNSIPRKQLTGNYH